MAPADDDDDVSSVDDDDEEKKDDENNTSDDVITDLSDSDVCTKYQEASKVVNLALSGLVSRCLPGATISELCKFGNDVITLHCSKLYNKGGGTSSSSSTAATTAAGGESKKSKKIEKGVAFPVCVSVNDIICNHCPLASEETVSFVTYRWFYYEFSSLLFSLAPSLEGKKRGSFVFLLPIRERRLYSFFAYYLQLHTLNHYFMIGTPQGR
jgi:hypothetical protein